MHDTIPLTDLTPSAHPDATQHNPAVRLAQGRYQRLRRLLCVPLIGLFLLAPWLTLNGAPLLWMDLDTRALHVVGLTLWPDDLLALTWLAFASAFGLFAVATLGGRLWCGFACPQTVWSMMFTWVEEHVQGSRQQRLKARQLPWSKKPWVKLALKHTLWLAIAVVTGFTFVAFFETGHGLALQIISGQAGVSVWFWLVFFSGLTYLNGGWLREQVCLHMCPYARFQSVMLDEKSLKVTYDLARGEPRSTLKAGPQADIKNLTKTKRGDCVDCSLCVQVCPVGIDIRQGLQYACIDCAACIDACDVVMEKTNRPKGLIRFEMATGNAFNGQFVSLLKKRGKLWGYLLLAILCLGAFAAQLALRETLDLHMTRDRGQLFFYNGDGQLANRYQLKLHNKSDQPLQLHWQVQDQANNTGLNGLTLAAAPVTLLAGEQRTVSLEIVCPTQCMKQKNAASRHNIVLNVNDHHSTQQWQAQQRFYTD